MSRLIKWFNISACCFLLAAASGNGMAAAPEGEPARQYQQYTKYSPFPMRSGVHLMVDWRFIAPGRIKWTKPTGKETDLYVEESAQGVRGLPFRTPVGVRLEVQQPQDLGPVIRRDKPWEHIIGGGWITRIGDTYHLWYHSLPPDQIKPQKDKPWLDVLICQAVFEDGLNWVKPNLDLYEVGRYRQTNVVPEMPSGGPVFIDPKAPEEERYKMMHPHPKGEGKEPLSIYLSTSPDLLHWTMREEPVFEAEDDGLYVVNYDEVLEQYVIYTRTFVNGRRTIGRSATDDLTNWPAVETVLWPEPHQPPWTDYYLSNYTRYPGTVDGHLMFPTVYDLSTDKSSVRMAVSPDNNRWGWVPGTVLETGPVGSWNGGCVFAFGNLIELPDGRVALPYHGYELPHKFPRYKPIGTIGMIAWPAGRLSALVVDDVGEFATLDLNIHGKRLYLNAETEVSGEIRLELLKEDNTPYEGYTLEDADPISGNGQRIAVTWNGKAELPGNAQRIAIRGVMRQARIFAIEVGE